MRVEAKEEEEEDDVYVDHFASTSTLFDNYVGDLGSTLDDLGDM